jgi:Ca2+-binding RTX toxin-like protein
MTQTALDTRQGTPPGTNAGPPYDFTTELMGQYVTIPLKDQGQLNKTEHGYRYWSGQQNSHLTVTQGSAGVRFVDTGTERWRYLPPACTQQTVSVGVAAVCRVKPTISERYPLLVEIWPRLGNDFTDTSSLPATFAVTVLGDKGNDTVRFGAGWDFFNGHTGHDVISGGAGNDWIRAGLDNDLVNGGSGNDDLLGMEGIDTVHGDEGDDRVGGGDQNDQLWGDVGTDFLLCGTGVDTANITGDDRVYNDCENVNRG